MELQRDRLIECRTLMNLSKREAAKRIGVSQPAYLRYESGERAPSLHVLKDIATVFHTSVDYLVGKSNNRTPETIIIKKSENPELFYLLENHARLDDEQRKRIYSYIEKIMKNN